MLFPKEIFKEKLLESKVWFSLIECKIIRKLLHTHPFFSCQSGRLGVHYVSRRGFGPALESRRFGGFAHHRTGRQPRISNLVGGFGSSQIRSGSQADWGHRCNNSGRTKAAGLSKAGQMALLSRSPVRMRNTESTEVMKILPSPISPVRAAS